MRSCRSNRHQQYSLPAFREGVALGSCTKTVLMVHAVDNEFLLKPTAALEYLHRHQAARGNRDQGTSILRKPMASGMAGASLHLARGDNSDLVALRMGLILGQHRL